MQSSKNKVAVSAIVRAAAIVSYHAFTNKKNIRISLKTI
jgi:hypothetical protein